MALAPLDNAITLDQLTLDPYPIYRRLRAEAPVMWHPETRMDGPGFWAVTRHEDVMAVNGDPTTYSSQRGGILMAAGRPEARHALLYRASMDAMINLDAPHHLQLRREHMPYFTPSYLRGVAEREGPVLNFATHAVCPSLHLLGLKRSSGALIFLRDHRELTRQAQEMKLASLGRLTASIAHNIRNPLSAVTHASQLLAEAPMLGEEERHLLATVQRNALRIEETVSSVLELSRRHRPQPQWLALNQWLVEFRDEYCASHRRARTALRLQLPRERLTIAVDPRHLSQILRNLCDNAFTHGQRATAPARVMLRAACVAHGESVSISVLDDGPGVPEEHVRVLFDPFFTTSSSGTGLGLYAARELAEANGLRLEYIPGPTRGAEFRLIAAG